MTHYIVTAQQLLKDESRIGKAGGRELLWNRARERMLLVQFLCRTSKKLPLGRSRSFVGY